MKAQSLVLLGWLPLLSLYSQPAYCQWGEAAPELKPPVQDLNPPAPPKILTPPPTEVRVLTEPVQGKTTVIETSPNKTTVTETTVVGTQKSQKLEKIRRDKYIAYRMAKDIWVDRACLADPELVEAICSHPGPAQVIAKHPHIAQIAEADPYLCRRLMHWKKAAIYLAKNPNAASVITRDPEGAEAAIQKRPKLGRILAKNVQFNQMIIDNPDLGRLVAGHM